MTNLLFQRFKSYVDYPAIISRVISKSCQDYQLPESSSVEHRLHDYPSETISRFPVGIKALVDQKTIGPTTIVCVERFLRFTSTNLDGATYLSIPTYFDHEIRNPGSFILAWDLYNTRPTTIQGEPSIELLLPTALMIYSSILYGPISLVGCNIRGCRSYITTTLRLYLAKRSKAEEHALFWMFVVAIESWRINVDDLRLEGQQLRDLMLRRFPWSSHRDVAISTLKNFFHDDDLFRSFR